MHGPEEVFVHVRHITAAEAVFSHGSTRRNPLNIKPSAGLAPRTLE
jgi:hypothetical protein